MNFHLVKPKSMQLLNNKNLEQKLVRTDRLNKNQNAKRPIIYIKKNLEEE